MLRRPRSGSARAAAALSARASCRRGARRCAGPGSQAPPMANDGHARATPRACLGPFPLDRRRARRGGAAQAGQRSRHRNRTPSQATRTTQAQAGQAAQYGSRQLPRTDLCPPRARIARCCVCWAKRGQGEGSSPVPGGHAAAPPSGRAREAERRRAPESCALASPRAGARRAAGAAAGGLPAQRQAHKSPQQQQQRRLGSGAGERGAAGREGGAAAARHLAGTGAAGRQRRPPVAATAAGTSRSHHRRLSCMQGPDPAAPSGLSRLARLHRVLTG
jgi:hypothetical protein